MQPDYRPMRLDEIGDSLKREVLEHCGVDVEKCLECGKCSGGCSNGHIFDYTPRKVIQLVKLNAERTLMNMDALWICLSCHLCVDRCPSELDTPRILDYMRQKAYHKKFNIRRPNVKLFYELMLSLIRRTGRVSELLLAMKFNWTTAQYMKDGDLGLKMFLKGKLNVISPSIKQKQMIQRLFKGSNVDGGEKP